AFFARSDSLVFFIVSRRHFAVARGATIQFDYVLFAEIDILLTVPAIAHRFFEQLAKGLFKIRQIDPVLRSLWSSDARLHLGQIQIDIDGVVDFAPQRHAEHFLGTKIIFERKALLFAASGGPQVSNRLLIDREISHRRTVLGRHVSNRRAVGHGQRRGTFAVELDKFTHYFLRAQQFRDVQYQVGRGDAFAQLSAHVHAHYFGC